MKSEIYQQLQNALGSDIAADTLEKLAVNSNISQLSSGSRLFASGDIAEYFVIVTSGQVKVQLSSRSGRDVILFRLSPGQCCALTTSCLLSNSPYYAEAIAETDLEILLINSSAFNEMLQSSPLLMQRLLGDLASRIAGLTSLVDRQVNRDLNFELEEFLSDNADSQGELRISHREIAQELGTAREVISRKLKELEKNGTVKLERGKIIMLDNAL